MLLESFLELRPQKIVFHNFLFVTHYAASVLLFLANLIYRQTEFDNNLPDQTITLSGLHEAKEITKQLQKLHQLLSSDDDKDEALHSVLNLRQLQKNQFSNALILYNNSVLVACYRRMLGEESFPTRVIIDHQAETLNDIKETETVDGIVC